MEMSISVPQRPIYPPYNSQWLDHIEDRIHPTRNETRRSLYSANAAPAPPAISVDHFAGSTPYCSKQFADTANSHLSETSALARRYYIRITHYKIHSLCDTEGCACLDATDRAISGRLLTFATVTLFGSYPCLCVQHYRASAAIDTTIAMQYKVHH